jgi:hypothetical protein
MHTEEFLKRGSTLPTASTQTPRCVRIHHVDVGSQTDSDICALKLKFEFDNGRRRKQHITPRCIMHSSIRGHRKSTNSLRVLAEYVVSINSACWGGTVLSRSAFLSGIALTPRAGGGLLGGAAYLAG